MIPESTLLAVATAPNRDSLHWEMGSVTWGEILRWVANPSDRKECGNYLLGTLWPTTVMHKGASEPCTNLHRRKDAIASRSAITLDVDSPGPSFLEILELALPAAGVVHTTFSSTPEDPRYRIIMPTDREMAPDEYIAVARALISALGEDNFDRSTTQPERYMFRPAAQETQWYSYAEIDGEILRVDDMLTGWKDDLSELPFSPPSRNKRDPFSIDGIIGAFNTAYADDWDRLIETYDLPYTRLDSDRYHLVGSRAQAGMGPIQGVSGLVYSHHANDPAYGKACSAFDLVRLHLFSELDEDAKPQTPITKLPSQAAMLELATQDPRALEAMVGDTFSSVATDDEVDNNWRSRLQASPRTGKFVDSIHNWDLIAENDPLFGLLYFNELTLTVEVSGDGLPWRPINEKTGRIVSNADRWEFCFYVERTYRFRPTRQFMDSIIDTKAARRRVNEVRDYLEELVWDGTPRLEECLPGVKPTAYTRLVARKALTAAVARMFDPGCKWDHTLVLYGSEGLGKTMWITRMARGFSATLGNVHSKDTLITMQRSWIMVSDEGYSLRKEEQDAQKEFLTRTVDVFRMPYDREATAHPRHGVIWSTTNDETFLRRQEGNRRFLIVHCENRVNFDTLTDDYVDQVWAEAVYRYRAGERLYLLDDEALRAGLERERYVEEDALAGIIQEYLDRLVPADWDKRSIASRVSWLADREAGFEPPGTHPIKSVCSAQIWVEALGRRIGDHRRTDLLEINNALSRLPGWHKLGQRRVPGYGSQKVFIRDEEGLL